MPDLLSELLAAPDAAARTAVIDNWPLSGIDEVELGAVKTKAAQLLRIDLQKSRDLAESMLRAADRTGNPLHRALGLLSLANAYSLGGLGRGAEAVALYDEAAAIYRLAARSVDEANAQIGKILILSDLGRNEEALAAGRWAAGVLAAYGEWLRLGKLTANLGNLHFRRGETAQALAMFDRARDTFARLPDDLAARQALGRIEHNRSAVLRDLGRFDEAISTAENALRILHETGQTAEVARCQLNLAIAYDSLGRYNDALALLAQSRGFFAADGRQRDAVMVGIYTGQCLLHLRRFDDVLALAGEASDQFERCGEQFYVAQALLNEATAYAGLDRYDEALAVLADARRRFEEAGNPMWAALTDLETAEVLRRLGRHEQSLDLALRCSGAFWAGELPVGQAEASLAAARAALALGRDVEAEGLIANAERVGRSDDLPSLLYPCHHLRSFLAERRGDKAAALREAEAGMNELERVRGQLMIEHRAEFLEDKAAVYEDGISLALALHHPVQALMYAERARSRALIELLDHRLQIGIRAATPEDGPLADELLRLRAERDALYRRWLGESDVAASGWASPGEERRQVQGQVLAIERRITELWRQLLVRNADYTRQASLWQSAVQPASLTLPPRAVLVEYTVSRGSLLAFVAATTPGGPDVRCIRLQMHLDQALNLLNMLQVNLRTVALRGQPIAARLAGNAQRLLSELYDGLIAPVAATPYSAMERADELLIVPYGPLHYLPFHALYDGAQYLAERWAVSYLPSLDLLPRLVRTANGAGRPFVLGLSEGRLPHAVEEANQVARLLGGAVFAEGAATAAALRTHAAHAPVVHLATHAEFRADNPLFSGLQLADAWLTTLDIFGLELDASLVTLSGCHTGRSVVAGGEELLGLARAFFAAGASSLLLSLWAVEDGSAAQFMEKYYGALTGGHTKASALQAAQRAFVADARYCHPYYWAPFALMGDTGCL
jgi:CHAT domain-containing protein/tetratricopeptide (TPR) repeat protein